MMEGTKRVERELSRFREQYDEYSIETVEREVAAENFKLAMKDAGKVVDVRVWVERGGEVLLIRDRNAPADWTEPGGTPESDEDYEDTARRETSEETGVVCEITDLRGVVRHIIRNEDEPESAVQMIQAFFRAESPSGTIEVQNEEVCEGRWWSTVPDAFHSDFGVPDTFSG
ncbi:NUDIX hydrolase [Natronosalvus caseinilyticus]|uniref:NUDIX hydrolase n=1 Tax=Natronosalvus caseinilyticus TaxID=2953747 RepID=UPI0028B0B875|nr:NUDIX hydrolase [Natronosalvus caseinilyticus]